MEGQGSLAKFALISLLLLSICLTAGATAFSTAGTYGVGVKPRSIAVGDFDGDGKLDVVVADFGSNNVSVLLGHGDGTFRPALNYRVGTGPQSVAVGDFNGDGKLDIAVANSGSNDLSILFGNGDGTFQRARSYRVGTAPRSIAVGDFNGDGKPDIAVANSGSNDVSVLLGNGDGAFRPAQNYGVGAGPQSVALGDFTGGGALGLAVASSGNSRVDVLAGKGDGTFQAAGHYGVGKNPDSLAVGDFDGDNHPDLVVTSRDSKNVSVLLARGDGTFHAAVGYVGGAKAQGVVVGDFNGDSKLAAAVVNPDQNNVAMLLGQGDGTLLPGLGFSAGSGPSSIAMGDFNGDGAPDLIVANAGDNTVSVLINCPLAQLSPGSLKFGVRGVGTQSAPMIVTLANRGSAPLMVTRIGLSGKQARDFAQTNTCPLTPFALAAHQTCTLNLTFTPSAVGTRKAALTVTDSAAGSPHSVTLTGGDPSASTIWKGGAGNWSDSTKWTNGVPTSATDALIDNGNATASPVTLDVGGQTNNLTIDGDDGLSFNNGTSLTINGSSVSNAGTMSLNSGGSLTTLFVASGATLTGVGAVTMSNNSQNQVDGNGGASLTNQSTIQGVGMIGPHFGFANQGTVNANVSGGILILGPGSGATYTNTATMEATNGGILQLNLAGVTNTGGTIKAVGTNSQVQFAGGGDNITGGTLSTSSGGTIVQAAGSSTLTNVTNSGTFQVQNGGFVNLSGTLTNTGTIQLNSAGSLTTLFAPTTSTLTGSGTVTMSNNSANQVDGNGGATLTNQSTIQGVGMIGPHFTLLNQGTVNANVNGAILAVGEGNAPSYTNSATLEATNGGILQIFTGGPGSLNNAGGTIKAVGTNSQVQFPGSGNNITGGTLSTSSGGTIVQAGGSSTLTNVTNSGTFQVQNGGFVNLSGTLTNTGTIQLNSTGSLTTLFAPTSGTLTGSGTVTMSNNSQNQVDGNSGATLTNQSTIQGVGMIGPHFTLTNQGTINANVNGAVLALGGGNASGYTNTATLEATNGGILQINTGGPGSINNAGGTIKAVGANSQIQFPGSGNNITGGTLSTSGGGTIVQTAGSSTLTNVTNSGTFQVQNGAFVNLSGTLTNNGTLQINSVGSLTGLELPTVSATLAGRGTVVMNNNPASVIDGNGGLTFTNQSTIQGGGTIGPHVTFNNKGTLNVTAANTLNINAPFVNFSGTTLKSGKYLVTGTLQFTGANIVTNAASLTLTGTASQIIDQNGANGLANFAMNGAAGSFTLAGNRSFTTAGAFRNSGTVDVSAGSILSIARGYTQFAGQTIVDGTLKARGLINIQAGNVFGTKTLAGSVTSSGTITPGDSATQTGLLAITGAYTQTSTGSLNISVGGLTAGTQFSQLNVAQSASVDGTLNLSLINGFVPNIGDTFKILNASSVSGTFATINSLCINSDEQFSVTYEATDVLLTVVAGACM
ncbi:MAG: FG-GAP-like repeat-containing protein [Acidobacteriia bacterium]|nr:FG-GAP-like repeat-containing protein [Terriglobia bacterium]